MSEKNKIQHIARHFLILLLLLFFIASKSVSLFHVFSHNSVETASVKVLQHDQSFFEKIIFSHEKKSAKNSDGCFLCSTANFQSQILFFSAVIFAAAIFYLTSFSRIFDRVKVSYLRSSSLSRAPPANS
jgi:hypothetical protein